MSEKKKKSTAIENGNPLYLQSSDAPGAPLVSNHLNGNNYLTWSRYMRIALGANVKLGFINGKTIKPSEDSETYDQWIRVDCMVRSWILSSISKEIIDAFLYTTTAKDLWDELEARFGECNGPLLYQLQREIASISQGNQTVAQYFTKLKKLWDEIQCLQPLPECICGAAKQINEYTSSAKLVQFLMGLNDSFDHMRNQVLVMDPLPDVNKAYSMVLRVEKEREVHNSFTDINDNSAMMVNQGKFKGGGNGSVARKPVGNNKPKFSKKIDKSKMECGVCHYTGHTQETCFQIHGVPDWYKKLVESRKTGQKNMVNMVENLGNKVGSDAQGTTDMSSKIQEMIQHEFQKFLKGKKEL